MFILVLVLVPVLSPTLPHLRFGPLLAVCHLGQPKSSAQFVVEGTHFVQALVAFEFGTWRFVEGKQPVDDVVTHDRRPVAVVTQVPRVLPHFCSDDGESAGGELVPRRRELSCRYLSSWAHGCFGKRVGDDVVVLAWGCASRNANCELVHDALGFDVIDCCEVNEDVSHRGGRHAESEKPKEGGDGQDSDGEAIKTVFAFELGSYGEDCRNHDDDAEYRGVKCELHKEFERYNELV